MFNLKFNALQLDCGSLRGFITWTDITKEAKEKLKRHLFRNKYCVSDTFLWSKISLIFWNF